MTTLTRPLAALAAIALLTGPAVAAVDPFTETFAENNANWGTGPDFEVFEPLDWSATGGPNGAAHVGATKNFADFEPGGFPMTIFRGQDNFGSSGGAFEGDWIAGGITEFSFWVRHDADIALTYFARFAPAGAQTNSPSMNLIFEETPVQPNTWTQLSIDISPDNPDWIVGGGPNTYNTVFGNLGKIQLGAAVGELAGIDQDFTFDLALVSMNVPAPGALAVLAFAGFTGRRRRS